MAKPRLTKVERCQNQVLKKMDQLRNCLSRSCELLDGLDTELDTLSYYVKDQAEKDLNRPVTQESTDGQETEENH